MDGLDFDLWEEISLKIEHHFELQDKRALNNDIRELFNKFEKLPPDLSWELAKKVYNQFKNDTPINMAFSIGISQNYHVLPNKEEAWEIFIKIPDNVPPIMLNQTKYWNIQELQNRSEFFDALKVWELLKNYSNDNDPEVRGEAGYTICEYIALKEDFPAEEGWKIIDHLLNDPINKVKERVSGAISYFYHELPQNKVDKYRIKLLKESSKEIKETTLNMTIEHAKQHAKKRNYNEGIKSLELILNNLKYYFIGVVIGISIFILFFGLLIYFVKDLWVFILYNAPILLLIPIITSFLFWKALKLEFGIKMIPFFLLTTFIPIFFLFPLVYTIFTFIFSINPQIDIYFVIGIIISDIFSLLTPFILVFFIDNAMKLLRKSPNYHLATGLYHYFKGREFVLEYLNAKNSDEKSDCLNKAIKNFGKSVKSYEKLQYGLEVELSLCPYCLNFYQGLEIYEKSLENPRESEIKKLKKKIEKSRSIMNETGKGSQKLNDTLTELVKTIKILVNLKEKTKNSFDTGVSDRIDLDNEIEQKSLEIDEIIQNINDIISEIEDQDLPIVLEILKSKQDQISGLNKFTQKGLSGSNELFLKNKYNKTSIITLILGVFLLILGFYLELNGLALIGFIFALLSALFIGYTSLIKSPQY